MSTLEKLKSIFDEINEKDNHLTREMSLTEDLGLSSLDYFQMVVKIEEKFKIKLGNETIQVHTVGDIVDFIDLKKAKKNPVKKDFQTKGLFSISLIKVIAMLGLVLVHIIEESVEYNLITVDAKNILEPWLIITVIGPSAFMMCMGFDMGNKGNAKQYLKCGISMLLIGILLNFFRYTGLEIILANIAGKHEEIPSTLADMMESDIYYFVGLFYIVFALFRKYKVSITGMIALSLVMLSANTIITKFANFGDSGISLLLGNIFYAGERSAFPLLSWTIFPVAGICLSDWIRGQKDNFKAMKTLFNVSASCLAVLLVNMWFYNMDIAKIVTPVNNDYITEFFGTLVQIFGICLLISLSEMIFMKVKAKVFRQMATAFGQNLMPFYMIHWLIVGNIVSLVYFMPNTQQTLNVPIILVASLLLTILCTVLTLKFGLRLMGFLLKITDISSWFTKKKPRGKKIRKPMNMGVKTLRDLAEAYGSEAPNETAFAYMDFIGMYEVTKSEFLRQVKELAGYLVQNGFVKKNIAILGANSYEWLVTYFAVISSGNTAALLDKGMKPEKLAHLVSFTDCCLVLYADSEKELAMDIKAELKNVLQNEFFTFEEIMEKAENTGKVELPEISENDTATIIYTSGTTGDSKGVMLSHKNLLSNGLATTTLLEEQLTYFLILPLHHAYALTASIILPMFTGSSIFICGNPKNFIQEINCAKPDIVLLVPALIQVILMNGKFMPGNTFREKLGGNLKYIVSGGAALPENVYDAFLNDGVQIFNGYGISECSPIVSTNNRTENYMNSLGLPLNCNEVKLSSEGEILVKGDNVMQGYYKQPDKTKEAFTEDGYFRTGDLGRFGEHGELYFTGRIKNLIILGNGENVPAEFIEAKLNVLEGVVEAHAYGENDRIVAEIYPDPEFKKLEELKAEVNKVNASLPETYRFGKIIFRETDFERTSTGKIKRS